MARAHRVDESQVDVEIWPHRALLQAPHDCATSSAEEGERGPVPVDVGAGFGCEEQGVRADHAGEGSPARDLDDGGEPRPPRRDHRVERNVFGLLAHGVHRLCHPAFAHRPLPALVILGQRITTEDVVPRWTDHLLDERGAFVSRRRRTHPVERVVVTGCAGKPQGIAPDPGPRILPLGDRRRSPLGFADDGRGVDEQRRWVVHHRSQLP